jgi:hypothetical protein
LRRGVHDDIRRVPIKRFAKSIDSRHQGKQMIDWKERVTQKE